MIDETLKCAFCFNLCERPVTVRRRRPRRAPSRRDSSNPVCAPSRRQAPCQHNFCLGCFTKWVQQSKTTCPTCRAAIPTAMRQNPRINAALVSAIRMARAPLPPPGRALRRVRLSRARVVAATRRRSAASGRRPRQLLRRSWRTTSARTRRS